MKIRSIESTINKETLRYSFTTAYGKVEEIDVINTVIGFDNGYFGYGSSAATIISTGESAQGMKAAIDGPITSALLNTSLLDINLVIQKLRNCCANNYGAKASIDIALHDAIAKYYDVPLYQYLGGSNGRQIESDVTITLDTPEQMLLDAKNKALSGFKSFKIKLGDQLDADIDRLRKLSEGLGDTVKFRLDANQGWSVKEALKIIRRIEDEKLPVEFVEQPVDKSDIRGLAFIRNQVETSIVADESLSTFEDAVELLRHQAVDIFNIKLLKCGGIREAMLIATLAERQRVPCMIGSMLESVISVTAAVHIAASHTNIKFVDLDAPMWFSNNDRQCRDYCESLPSVEVTDRAGLGLG